MNAPRIALLVVPLVLTAPINVLAQQGPVVAPGARVRLKAPSVTQERLVGTVVEMGADTCVLEVEGRAAPLALPLVSVTSLEVSRGRMSNLAKGGGLGLLGGGAMGVAFGVALCSADKCSAGEAAAYLGAIGGGAGLLIGAAAGAASKTDRWEEVPLGELRVGPSSVDVGGIEVSVTLRL